MTNRNLIKHDGKNTLSKVVAIPANLYSGVDVAIYKANKKGRVKMLEADMIIESGLLRK